MAINKTVAAGVELTAIDTKKETQWSRSVQQAQEAARGGSTGFREVDIEEDDLEQPITARAEPDEDEAPEVTAAGASVEEPAGLYYPYVFFLGDLRGFHPRKGGRVGTRMIFNNGAAQPVKETFAEVKAAFGITS